MSETASERVPEEKPADAAAEPKTVTVGTPVWVWVVYGLGILAAGIFALSLLFVAVAFATSGDGASGVNVATPAFVLWLGLLVAALGTFLWRRYGGSR